MAENERAWVEVLVETETGHATAVVHDDEEG